MSLLVMNDLLRKGVKLFGYGQELLRNRAEHLIFFCGKLVLYEYLFK